MSRQQRRAAERAAAKRETFAQFKRRVHAEVAESTSLRELWLTYYGNRFEARASRPLEPEHIALLEEVFYAGVASMCQINNKIAEEAEDEEEGAMLLQRVLEELQAAVDRLTT